MFNKRNLRYSRQFENLKIKRTCLPYKEDYTPNELIIQARDTIQSESILTDS